MKRSFVAMGALGLLAGAAQAQVASGLTLYGGVDGNITRTSATGKPSQWDVRDGGLYVSKIGFIGNEDLGGGFRAHFMLESQFNADTGAGSASNSNNTPAGNVTPTGITFNRKATVSLFTPVGEARIGRDYTSTFVPATYFDPFFSAGVASATNFQVFYTPTLALPTLVRVSNSAAYYIPPTWLPGLYAYAQAAPSERGANFIGVGTGYRKGPLLVSAAIARTEHPLVGSTGLSPATVGPDNTLKVWSLGASYNFNGLKPMGFYHSQTFAAFGTTAATTETDRRVDDWLLGFSWAIGVNDIKFAYMRRNDKGAANNDADQVGLGYAYNLSKRTAVYANFVNIRNHNGAAYNYLSSGLAPNAGGTGRALQSGLSHNF
jgi:predicted porin